MYGYAVSHASGRVAAGEVDQVFTPRGGNRPGKCGVILVHGSGNPQGFIDGQNQPSSVRLAAALCCAGMPLISGDFGLQAWGNDTVVARIDAAWNVLKAKFPSMRTDKVILIGASMGGAAVARYSQNNPTKVAAVVGLIPLLDLKAFYNNPVWAGAVQNEVAAAWGVTAPAALPTRADIASTATLARNVPHLLGYSSVDTTVLPAWVLAYAKAVNATKVVTDSTYGHSDQAVGGLPISTVGKFLTTYGA